MIEGIRAAEAAIQLSAEGWQIGAALPPFGKHVHICSVHPGAVEAWRLSPSDPLMLVPFSGSLKLVCFDARRDSHTFGAIQEIFAGARRPRLVEVPAGVGFGWCSLGNRSAALFLCSSSEGFPADYLPADSDRIPYQW